MTDFQENPPHPLFPPLDDDDDDAPAALISEILIMRAEQGKKVTCPRMFRGEELMSLNDLASQYGGGEYELVGRHNNRITARRRYTIPGPMKPMFEGLENPTPSPAQAPPAANPLMGGLPGGEGSIMGLLMMMMQQMMQSQQAAAQQNTQLMIAMMTNNQQASADEKAAARAEMAANIERERIASERNLAMMREMMTLSQKPSSGSGEEFIRGVEYMRGFAVQQIETLRNSAKGGGDETDWGSILETLGQVMQGAGMLKGMMGGAPEAAAQAATEVVQ